MKVALVNGINLYKYYSQDTLRGAVNDAQRWRQFFHNEMNVVSPTVLTDYKAEERRVKDVLNSFKEESLKGDIKTIFLAQSSHGSNTPDKDGDEPDRLDEILCMADIKEEGGEWVSGFLSDDWLYSYAVSLPSWVVFECFFDACHSQTMLREMGTRYGRAKILLPPNPVFTRAPKDKLLVNDRPGLSNTVSWSGCDAKGTSADTYEGNQWCGAMTYFFFEARKWMKDNGKELQRTDVIYHTRRLIHAKGYGQTPHLEAGMVARYNLIGE